MRCDCCNNILSYKESTAKAVSSGEYTNTCFACLREARVQYTAREDIKEDYDDTEEDELIDYEEPMDGFWDDE